MSVWGVFVGIFLGKIGILDKTGVVGMGFQCEQGICLSKIDFGVEMSWFYGNVENEVWKHVYRISLFL
jgi:hypothetical protein